LQQWLSKNDPLIPYTHYDWSLKAVDQAKDLAVSSFRQAVDGCVPMIAALLTQRRLIVRAFYSQHAGRAASLHVQIRRHVLGPHD
jgi:hypothetical protein